MPRARRFPSETVQWPQAQGWSQSILRVTQFMVEMVNPQLGEKVLDPACGTGGFLTCAIKHLRKQVKTPDDEELLQRSVLGIEKCICGELVFSPCPAQRQADECDWCPCGIAMQLQFTEDSVGGEQPSD